MNRRKNGVTLQINLCASDLSYCERTVPALVATHRPDVDEVLLVADACRPQSTPFHHRPSRIPAAPFAERIAKLRVLCEKWRAGGLADRVVFVEPAGKAVALLNRQHTGRQTAWSHDHLGHAFAAYFAGWSEARTRYVAHFDADILLHQDAGFSWVRTAVTALEHDPKILAVSPRIAPPMRHPPNATMVRVDAPGSGWLPTWRLDEAPLGWHSDWFSTRCHLMDLDRYRALLPLTPRRGALADALSHAVNVALSPWYESPIWTLPAPARGARRPFARAVRRLAKIVPAFPLPPEVLLHERAAEKGMKSLYLGDPRAWYIHPDTKADAFLDLLPRLLDATARGECPPDQLGVSGIQFDAWATA